MVQNRDTQVQPIMGDYNERYVSTQANAELGDASRAFRFGLLSGEPICFNQSKYFAHNGDYITQCRWKAG